MNKVLFFGPFPPPITGQSLSIKEVFNNYNGKKIIFDTTKFKGFKILNSLHCLLSLPFIFIVKRFDRVYFTCSRSSLGFLKDFLLLLLCKISNKKVINHLHGGDFAVFYQDARILKPFIKWSYNNVDSSIILLPSMISQFDCFPNMNISVIRNSYPSEFEDTIINLEDKKNQILYLSNLMESKGIFVFMESIIDILENHSTVVIKIAGEPMDDYLSSAKEVRVKFEIKYNRLKRLYPNRLFYVGVISGCEKEKILTESSLFVLPTFHKTEASPLSIIEAMRFGNAIITTNHNYLNDIVNERNGFLVETKSVNDLTNKIELLIFNKARLRNIQMHNIIEAKQKYSPRVFNSEIEKAIENL